MENQNTNLNLNPTPSNTSQSQLVSIQPTTNAAIMGEIVTPNLNNVSAQSILKIEELGKPSMAIKYRSDISFATQKSTEKVYALIRKHWITNINWVFRYILYSILPIILIILVIGLKLNTTFLSLKAFFLIIMIYYSFIFTNIIRLFFNWYFNLFFITDERIIQYKFKILGKYIISEINLENIDDIKQSSGGFLGQFLDFGDLEVCGENVNTQMFLNKIAKPTEIRTIVTDLFKQAKLKYERRR